MSHAMLPARTDVLVIGAGPTGLALAVSLIQTGIDTVIVDKLHEGLNTSRAAVIHAHTLEALRPLGVAERLSEAGLKLSKFSIRDRDQVLVRLNFDQLPSEFAHLLMVPQDVTESILEARLEELGGRVHRGAVADCLEERGDCVRVWVTDGDVKRAIDARYVVGADGMHSMVRGAAGIAFDGGAYEKSFVLADVRMDWPLGREEVMLFFSPAGLVVVAPLPNGNFRVVAALDQAPENPKAHDIQRILDASGPRQSGARIEEVVWSSRFRIHHRLAQRYRRGRLMIMGDAAHVHSPAGGQGMNTGLVDATVLAQVLAAVVSGRRGERALDRYERLRRPAARKVMHMVGELTEMAMMKGAAERGARNARLSLMGALPPVKRRLIMNLSGLSRRASAEARL